MWSVTYRSWAAMRWQSPGYMRMARPRHRVSSKSERKSTNETCCGDWARVMQIWNVVESIHNGTTEWPEAIQPGVS